MTAHVGDLTFSAATSVVAVGLLVELLLIYLLLLIVGLLIGLPRRMRARRAASRRQAGDGATTRALVALAAGDTADARREAARARRLLGDTPQTLLLAAEAGRLAGRMDEANEAWRQLAARPEAAFLGYRGLLRQAMEHEDWVEADVAGATGGGGASRRDMAARGARAACRADVPLVGRLGAGGRRRAKGALATAAANAELDSAAGLRLARQAWKEDPALAPAALAYARRLREAGREGRAQGVIRQSWAVAPNPDLAAFALAPVEDKLARMQAAQRLTKSNPDHPESRLLLAATALDAGLLGEARRHLDTARESGVNQRRLLTAAGARRGGGARRYRARAAGAARRPAAGGFGGAIFRAWYCSTCHAPQQEWVASCPNCGAAGSLRWGSVSVPVAGPLLAGEPRLPEPAVREE